MLGGTKVFAYVLICLKKIKALISKKKKHKKKNIKH